MEKGNKSKRKIEKGKLEKLKKKVITMTTM